ncbi:MAG: hypothetical protein ACPGXZ_10630, partial [Saprospiraceae bacterium]
NELKTGGFVRTPYLNSIILSMSSKSEGYKYLNVSNEVFFDKNTSKWSWRDKIRTLKQQDYETILILAA